MIPLDILEAAGAASDDELRAFSYEPQLERSMGVWSSFSVSFSCMGVTITFAYSLGMVGPIFVWTWLFVSIGLLLVALVLRRAMTPTVDASSSPAPPSGKVQRWHRTTPNTTTSPGNTVNSRG